MRNRTDIQRKDFDQLKQSTQNFIYSFDYNVSLTLSRYTLKEHFKDIFSYYPPNSMNRRIMSNILANYIYDQRNILRTEAELDNAKLDIRIPQDVIRQSSTPIDKSQELVKKQQEQLKQIADLLSKITFLEEKINTLQLDNTSFKTDLTNANNQKKNLQTELDKLNDKLAKLKKHNTELQSSNTESEKKYTTDIQIINEKKSELNELLKKCNNQLDIEKMNLKLLNEKNTIEINELKKKIQIFKDEISSLKKEIKTINIQNKNISSQQSKKLQQLQARYNELESTNTSSISNINNQILKETENLDKCLEKSTKLEETISQLKTSHQNILNKNTTTISQLKKEKEQIKNQYNTLKSTLIEKEQLSQQQIDRINSEMITLKNTHDTSISKLNKIIKEKTNLLKENDTKLKKVITELETAKESLFNENRKIIDKLTEEKKQIKNKYNALQSKFNQMEKQYQQQIYDINTEMLNLKKSHETAISKLNKTISEKTSLLEQNNTTIEKLNRQLNDIITSSKNKLLKNDKTILNLQEKITELNKTIVSNKKQYDLNIDLKKQTIKEQLDIINKFTNTLSKTKTSNDKSITECNEKIESLTNEINNLKTTLKKTDKTILNLQEKITNLNKIINANNITIKSYVETISLLKLQISKQDTIINNLNANNSKLITNHKTILFNRDAQIQQLIKKLNNKTNEFNKIKLDLENCNNEVFKLLNNIASLKSQLNEKNIQLSKTKKKITNCTKEFNELKSIKNTFTSQRTLLNKKLNYIVKNYQNMKNQKIKDKVIENINTYNEILSLNNIWIALSSILKMNIDEINNNKCDQVIDILERLNHYIEKLRKNRSNIYSDYEDVKGVARIFLRVRGGTGTYNNLINYNNNNNSIEYNNPCTSKTEVFDGYTNIFRPNENNIKVFNTILPLIKTIRTNNILILGYGRSGSGKTYTLLGNNKIPGIIQLTIRHLLNNKAAYNINKIKLSSLELYIRSMYDLLKSKPLTSSRGLTETQINWLTNPRNVWPPKDPKFKNSFLSIQNQVNKTSIKINTIDDIDIINNIMKNRMTAATENNPVSSRSHLLLIFSIEFNTGLKQNIVFADLAGNEEWWNFNKLQSSSTLIEEGKSIGRGLYSIKQGLIEYHSGRPLPSSNEKIYKVIDNFIDFDKSKGGNNAKIGLIFNTKDFLSITNPSQLKYECASLADTFKFSQDLINS